MFPERISCSASLTASAGFQVSSAAKQHAATKANTRKCTSFIRVRIESDNMSESEVFSASNQRFLDFARNDRTENKSGCYSTVIITFPFAWPSSRYRIASGTSLNDL